MSAVSDLLSVTDNMALSPIKDFYVGKNVFLTGCTGAVGEVILEKLLRCETNRIYVLCRAKKGVSALERLEAQFKSPLFEKLTELKPDFMKRIRIIYGDIKIDGLAISPEQRLEIITEIDIVIHLAADVNFEQPLPDILLTNVRGTREILALAKEMRKLLVFTYCSTAYSHCVRSDIDEKFYPTPMEANEAIRLAEHFLKSNGTELDVLTKLVINPWPNVYTFSKAIAENLIEQATKEFPIVLIRPSIVLPTRLDPIPGYGTNLYGLTGYYLSAFVGLLRVQDRMSIKPCMVCADDVCNGTMVAIWDRATTIERNEAKIFNFSFQSKNLDHGALVREAEKLPPGRLVYMPVTNSVNNALHMNISIILSVFLPAILLESYLVLVKSETRVLKLYRKVLHLKSALAYFGSRDWTMSTQNLPNLWKQMSVADREFFPCDLSTFEWTAFVADYWFGIKKYLLKESMDPESVAAARSNVFKIRCSYYGSISVWILAMFGLAYYCSWYLPLILSLLCLFI